jgi:hypothetical protein
MTTPSPIREKGIVVKVDVDRRVLVEAEAVIVASCVGIHASAVLAGSLLKTQRRMADEN